MSNGAGTILEKSSFTDSNHQAAEKFLLNSARHAPVAKMKKAGFHPPLNFD